MSQTSYEPPIAGLAGTPARLPWRLRLAIVFVAFSVASPVIVALVWLAAHHPPGFGLPASAAPIPGAPGPYDPDMAAAYRSYLEKEGRSRRGAAFADCAMRLNMLMVPRGCSSQAIRQRSRDTLLPRSTRPRVRCAGIEHLCIFLRPIRDERLGGVHRGCRFGHAAGGHTNRLERAQRQQPRRFSALLHDLAVQRNAP